MANRENRLQEELQFHLEQQIAKNIRSGMSPAEARRNALIKFGGVEPAREAARDQVRGAWVLDLFRDMRIGLRSLGRVPTFAVTTILTLAFGVGTAAAMFSVFQGVLLKALPYPDSDRIVRLYQLGEKGGRGNVSEPNFNDWRDGTHSFAAMAEMQNYGLTPVAGAGDAQLARVTRVSKTFFDVMGVRPALGRGFRPEEQQPSGPRVMLVSAGFWKRWRGSGTPQGETLRCDNEVFTVVGVMPEGFDYPNQTALWVPREMTPPQSSRTAHNFQVIARLGDGVPLEQAQADISTLSRRLKDQYGDGTWMFDAAAVPLLEAVTSTSKATLQLLLSASVLLLIVACTNVSNLLVVRAASRRPEFAVQLAMGASAGRIGRQLLAETLVICLAGAGLGVLVASSAVRLFVALAPATVQRLDGVTVSWPAVAFAVGVALVAAIALSAVTAIGTRSVRITEALSDSTRSGTGGRRQMRVREGLIVTQVALALVLVSGAALLGRSLYSVMSVDPGYSLEDGLIVGLTVPGDGSPAAAARQVATHDAVLDALRRQPGVTGVGLVNDFPLGGGAGANGTFIEMTRPDEITSFAEFDLTNPRLKAMSGVAEYRQVSGDYFTTMGIRLLEGRLIKDSDSPASGQIAVVSRSLAEAQWPGRSALGRWIQFGNMDGDLRAIQIVGVVGDVREVTPEAQPQPTLYASARQRPAKAASASIIVRGPASVTLADTARRIVREINSEVPVVTRTVSAALDAAVGSRRFTLWLVGAFGIAALALAMLGVYGLVAYTVSLRTREMGIRMALGAEPKSLVWLVAKRGALLAAVGAGVGIAIARVSAGALEGLLYGVTAADPLTIATAAAFLLAASMAATYAPARRILKQTPGKTLRDI
ncbi:MAG TPA: ABC transporter permease [Vicinamibacterales bacterium]|nr:ABC transporter permease [Vicinamibacterales bacterium]